MATPNSSAIRHVPQGFYPDGRCNFDRVPRRPLAGDFVLVKAEIRADVAEYGAVLRCDCNGTHSEIPGRHVRDFHETRSDPLAPALPGCPASAVEYFLFELGRFDAGDSVEYLICGGKDSGTTCGPFRFTVDSGYSAVGRAGIFPVEEGVIADFGSVGPYRPVLRFAFVEGRLHVGHSLTSRGSYAASPSTAVADYRLSDPRTGVQVSLAASPFRFEVTDSEGRRLFGSPAATAYLTWNGTATGQAHSLVLRLDSVAEHYFGLGERFDALDQNGRNPTICVVSKYTQQGDRTYLPIPFFLTERGYGLFARTDRYAVFRLAPRLPGVMSLEADVSPTEAALELVFFFGPPKALVRAFTLFTGPPALPPRWAFGPWMSGNAWNTQREVEEHLATTSRLGIPATVLVIEAWSDECTFYVFNDAGYAPQPGDSAFRLGDFTFPADGKWPDPKALVDRVHDRDMRLVLWQIPVLKHSPGLENEQRRRDEAHAIAHGYCVRNADGTPYRIPDGWFSGSLLLDFTNPAAREWWFAKRRYLVDELGVDGFKTDGGEFVLDESVRFSDGSDGATMRNRYPSAYVHAYHEFMRRGKEGGAGHPPAPDVDVMVTFSRSGFTGAQRFPLYWAGDQVSTFAEMRAVLTAGLSLGLSGCAFWGFDIGGFSGDIPTADLFIRATQMAAFSPAMQFHSEGRGEHNSDRTPWNVGARTGDERVVPIYRRYANIRMNLLPYIYHEAANAAAAGEPLMRALAVDFPDDPPCLWIDDEYLFGRDLLIAPVLTEHTRERRIYLPESEEWVDLWTLEPVPSGWLERYRCDLDTMPVFLRRKAILPLNLGDEFSFGSAVTAPGTALAHLCFLIPATPAEEWEFSDETAGRVRFTPAAEGLRVSVVEGPLSEVYLLSPAESPRYEGGAHRAAWNGPGVHVCVCRVAAHAARQPDNLPSSHL